MSLCELFQFHVAALQQRHYFRIEPRVGSLLHLAHGLFQRNGRTILAIGGESVQAIHHGKDSGPDGNIFTGEARWIS